MGNKIKLVAKFKDAPEFSKLCSVVDPARLIGKSPKQYKFWFSLPEDCKEAEAAILKAFPGAACEVIGEISGSHNKPKRKPIVGPRGKQKVIKVDDSV
jgi:hypothetical protein